MQASQVKPQTIPTSCNELSYSHVILSDLYPADGCFALDTTMRVWNSSEVIKRSSGMVTLETFVAHLAG